MPESLKKSCSHNFFFQSCFAQNHKWLNFYYKVFLIKGHFRHTDSTKVSNFVKLNLYHFWPLCNTKIANFAIFHDKKLKFSPQTLAWSFSKHSGQIFFKLTFDHFWPLCNIKNANFAIFHARELKFSPQSPCLVFFNTQWSKNFRIDF